MDGDGPGATDRLGLTPTAPIAAIAGINADRQAPPPADATCGSGFRRESPVLRPTDTFAAEAAPTAIPGRGPAALARRYRRELILVVLIKLALLTAAYRLWFAHPQAQHMHMPAGQVEQHLFDTAPGASDSTSQGATR